MDTDLDTVVIALGPDVSDAAADRLVETAMQVAGPTDATVVLAYVFSGEQFIDAAKRLGHPDASREDVDDVLADHETVERLGATLADHGITYAVRGAVGKVAEEVVAIADDVTAGRVIVSGRPRSPTGKAVFGSTAQSVILDASCPVTYVAVEE
ncbi:universal stress protein UspA [Halarchaeum grantii]|uniref:Universal stress protein UspA n=1 Tax=Halarchaeum grantii TaxID=1193105 RepID=A0A830F6K6_9EURY|nr:universal stress protein [Halarchaeum grantii]GGL25108.1 universal stress protein UspA [Halarchaeum grantii]